MNWYNRAHRAGGALSAWPTSTPRSPTGQRRPGRSRPAAAARASVGRARAGLRQNLFASPLNTVADAARPSALLYLIVPPLLDWAIFDADVRRATAPRATDCDRARRRLLGLRRGPLRPVHLRLLSAEPSAGASTSPSCIFVVAADRRCSAAERCRQACAGRGSCSSLFPVVALLPAATAASSACRWSRPRSGAA